MCFSEQLSAETGEEDQLGRCCLWLYLSFYRGWEAAALQERIFISGILTNLRRPSDFPLRVQSPYSIQKSVHPSSPLLVTDESWGCVLRLSIPAREGTWTRSISELNQNWMPNSMSIFYTTVIHCVGKETSRLSIAAGGHASVQVWRVRADPNDGE